MSERSYHGATEWMRYLWVRDDGLVAGGHLGDGVRDPGIGVRLQQCLALLTDAVQRRLVGQDVVKATLDNERMNEWMKV